jgi:hypothetical protein
MKVRVVCFEGFRAEETPRAFLLGERRVEWEIQLMESPPSTG